MGNCCNAESRSMEWAGEDWSDLVNPPEKNNTVNRKRRPLKNKVIDDLGATICDDGNNNNNNGSRIKIRISKKELARLLSDTSTTLQERKGQFRQRRASAEQVLLRLLKARDDAQNIHTPWKPQLDSIPEDR
ncbi:hypothetical protein PIB30_045522 [Stylosanthes scabra]|uniref:Uncharacterized protein n=1 Tax=Stylosanthes scabra TaxID=79078 RepID=A0ABU6RG75_9FABA|nr:hypothetical protein [Stylosanthes scabra]